MKVVTVACDKGGTGKTTSAMCLAISLSKLGKSVVVFDADNTGGATTWEACTKDDGKPLPFQVVPVNRPKLDRLAKRKGEEEDFVIIDTPPSDTAIINSAIEAADLVIIPTQPSRADTFLAGDTYRSSDKPSYILLTRVKARTKLLKETLKELQDAEFMYFPTYISESESVKRLYGGNETSPQYDKVCQEMLKLLDE
ncbi:MAG: ParA family protein [Aeriscardovia sp.]|nr:ParA family protein [Aeriscardovia sp.]